MMQVDREHDGYLQPSWFLCFVGLTIFGALSTCAAFNNWVAGIFTTHYEWLTWSRYWVWEFSDDARWNFTRFALALGVLIGACGLIGKEYRSFCERQNLNWSNLADPKCAPSWGMIFAIVTGSDYNPKSLTAYKTEPLMMPKGNSSPKRQVDFILIIKFYAKITIILCATLVILSAIAKLPLLGGKSSEENPFFVLGKIVSSPVPFFIALATAFFAFRQMQAQQKAKSRQEWIDKLRSKIAQTLALAQEYRDCRTRPSEWEWLKGEEEENGRRQAKLRHDLTDARLEMELLLNPSEKDHRLLMYLVQRLALWHNPNEKGIADFGENLDDQKFLRLAIAEARCGCKCVKESTNMHHDCHWHQVLHSVDYGMTVSHAMRLAHVILKREWERVKTTQ